MRHIGLLSASLAFAIGACSTVLGIEELESGVNPDKTSGGATATGGRGGEGGTAEPTGGKATTGGTKASGGAGGAVSSGGVTNTGGIVTQAGEAGESSGEGGEGEGGAPASSGAVTGKVIDFWGHAVPKVPISISGNNAVTDNDGTFRIEDVTAPYDVSLRIETDRLNYAWVYQGLTRFDPTLQVMEGSNSRGATITFHTTGAEHEDPNVVQMAIGGDDGSYTMNMSGPDVQSSWSWLGPATTMVTGHALWWTESENAATPGPDKFLGYGSVTGSATDAVASELTIDLGDGAIDAITIQGSVTREIDEDPTNMVSLRFAGNAVIDLLNVTAMGSNFSYQVPSLPDAGVEVVVAASHGETFFGPYGVAHAVAGTGPVSLTPPVPPTVISPGAGTSNVGAATVFEWSSVPGVKVLHIEDNEYNRGMFVVTDAAKLTLPEAVGFELRRGAEHHWTIEVHGAAANVDEATGKDGFMDSYSYYDHESPRGPRRGGGSFSYAARRLFTTAP